MSTIDPGMESMLELFIYESTTLLDQLDELLLESEKEKTLSEDSINEIFRIMHTIKGSSAMMGFSSISDLSHAVEDVFAIIREEPGKMEPVSEAIFNHVFQASDFLKAEIDAVQGEDYEPRDCSAMVSELEKVAQIMNGQAPATPAPAAASAAAPVGSTDIFQGDDEGSGKIRVYFEDGCQMENVRAFMLLSQLKDVCDTLESIPPSPEKDSSLCNEIIKNGFVIVFTPASAVEDVIGVIEKSINIKSYQVLDTENEVTIQTASTDQGPASSAAEPSAENAFTTSNASASNTGAKNVKQSLISVNQSKLDQLMDLVGELVTTESMVASNPDLKGLRLDNFNKSTRELRKLTDELQNVVMSMRMVPLTGTFQKMHRIVRDMGKKLGKEVNFETLGGETEVDKTIVDSINDPFMHMIRNSMDHAIEPPEERVALGKPEMGTVTLSAQNVGGEIVIKVGDDGRGLNVEKILAKAKANGILTKAESEYTDKEIFGLIMLPGFSTKEKVSEFSGRGVGMDVVHKNIEKIGGSISIDSERNKGTVFTIKIPLTLAIVDGMEVSVGDSIFTMPITSIRQSFKADEAQIIHDTNGSEMIMLRGECYPIIRLHRIFNIPTEITSLTEGILIQVEASHSSACIYADELLGEQQVVVKAFPTYLNHYRTKGRGISGCTILGDGSISLILDANSLLNY